VAYIVKDCSAKVLVVSDELKEICAPLRAMLPANFRCFTLGQDIHGDESWDAVLESASVLPISD
jgi:hypothetical protein